MTTTEIFSAEEIKSIQLAPALVVAAAAASEPGGPVSVVKEMVAGMGGLAKSMQETQNAFVQELFEKFDKDDFGDDEISNLQSPGAHQKLIDESLLAARSAMDLVSSRVSQEDADAYAQALLNAAQAAVNAAKTGSFLGFGGTAVTKAEAQYVKSLADTLGFREV